MIPAASSSRRLKAWRQTPQQEILGRNFKQNLKKQLKSHSMEKEESLQRSRLQLGSKDMPYLAKNCQI